MYAQSSKSDRRGIPVDSLVMANGITAISGETVQFYYNSSGTLTADAGQAAAVIVVAKLASNHILNKLGGNIGVFGDTSLSFTSTAFTTEINVGPSSMEALDSMTEVERLVFLAGLSSTQLSPFTANGQYFVDYNRGYIYGRKASTQSTLTSAAYSIPAGSTSSAPAFVSVTSVIPGTGATNLGKAEDAPHTSGDVGVEMLAVRNDGAATSLTNTDGDYSPVAVDIKGRVFVGGNYAEDAAHTTGDMGIQMLAVRNDAGGALAGTTLDYIPLTTDAAGNENVTAGTLFNGERSTPVSYIESIPAGTPTYISTATTTLVKSGAGIITGLFVGKHIATGVIQIYDGLTAVNLIQTITVGAALLTDPPLPATMQGVVFNVGLTIVTSLAGFLAVATAI